MVLQNYILDVKVTSDIGTEPVTVAEAKAYLHIDFSTDDTFIGTLITAARKRLERYTGVSFGTKTIKAYMEMYYQQEIPYGPIQSVTQVRSFVGGTEFETLASDEYELKGSDYQIFNPEAMGEYELTYQAGYTTLPDDLKLAILAEVAFRYENRGDDNVKTLCNTAKDLAIPYKRLNLTV
jgi:uncharacterized phiE125 gp8 family phage protein